MSNKNHTPKPVAPKAETPAPAPVTPPAAPVAEFNPVTVEPVSTIPGVAASGLTGNALVLRINPKAILDVDTPEKLYEHARAAWSGKEVPSATNIKHVIVMTKETVKVTRDNKPVNELKTSVLAVYDVSEFHAFTEADVPSFKCRTRASFCKIDKDGKVTDTLMEKRWMFTGTLNEKATTALKGLFWTIPFGMFWKIKNVSPTQFLTECVSVTPPAKMPKAAATGTRDFTVKVEATPEAAPSVAAEG